MTRAKNGCWQIFLSHRNCIIFESNLITLVCSFTNFLDGKNTSHVQRLFYTLAIRCSRKVLNSRTSHFSYLRGVSISANFLHARHSLFPKMPSFSKVQFELFSCHFHISVIFQCQMTCPVNLPSTARQRFSVSVSFDLVYIPWRHTPLERLILSRCSVSSLQFARHEIEHWIQQVFTVKNLQK